MDQSRRHLVVGLVLVAGGLLVTVAALDRLGSPTLRALGGRELLIMVGLLIVGVAVVILGACEAAEHAFLPSILPSPIVWLGATFAGIDAVRVYADSFRFYGDRAGPLAEVSSFSIWTLLLGAALCGGGVVLARGRLGAFHTTEQSPGLSETSTGDPAKTFHADRWWMRDRSGSVLIWNDQAQTWSPWVYGRDPGLPPGWS